MKGLADKARALLRSLQEDRSRRPAVLSTEPSNVGDVLRKEGDFWTITYNGHVSLLKDIKGLSYISLLLRHPGVEVHSMSLLTGEVVPDNGRDAASNATSDTRLEESGLSRRASIDAGEMLDPQAKAAYRERLSELRTEREEATRLGNAEHADAIEGEIEALMQELSRAVGLGGRDRRAADATERARLNVTRAIKTAIERIAKDNPTLGTVLTKTIRTGVFCSYVPETRQPSPQIEPPL
jgi:hypothetical protein